jgi:hypothetical protein
LSFLALIHRHIDSISYIPLHPENPLGPVKSGLLVLAAPLLPVRLALPREPDDIFDVSSQATLVSHPNESCPLRTHWTFLDIQQQEHGGVDYCKEIPQSADSPGTRPCSCLLQLFSQQYLACGMRRIDLGGCEEEPRPDGAPLQPPLRQKCRMLFLLLETTSDQGVYRRVGVVSGEVLRTMDGDDPVGAGDGAEKLFWETLPPGEPPRKTPHDPPISSAEAQKALGSWPSRIELEWKQVRII